jgi:hypothetical protein
MTLRFVLRTLHLIEQLNETKPSLLAMGPAERMIRLYHHPLDQMGEATDVIEFDETTAGSPPQLPFVHMVADHCREEFVEFIEGRKVDLFSDRYD